MRQRRLAFLLVVVCLAVKAKASQPVVVTNDVRVLLSTTTAGAVYLGALPVGTTQQNPIWVNATASGDNVIISSPSAGARLYIRKVVCYNAAAANVLVSLRGGSAGTVVARGEIPAEGGAIAFSFGNRGWQLPTATQLSATLGAASDVDVNVMDYYIGP